MAIRKKKFSERMTGGIHLVENPPIFLAGAGWGGAEYP